MRYEVTNWSVWFARFTVEIADFDFGQSDDLEYKTFRKRLMDAVNNAVNRVEVLDEENTATCSGNKYGTLEWQDDPTDSAR